MKSYKLTETPLPMILGCCWLIAYVIAIKSGHDHRVYGPIFVILCLHVIWGAACVIYNFCTEAGP